MDLLIMTPPNHSLSLVFITDSYETGTEFMSIFTEEPLQKPHGAVLRFTYSCTAGEQEG